MLKAIITYLNLKLELLNYFDLTRCLVELKESETDNGTLKQPVEYISNGEFDVINFDEFNGVSYWRLRDEPSTDRTETQKYRAGAKNNIETTIPLRLVFAVPRTKLTEDDAYSFDRIRQTMVKQFAIDDEVLRNQLGAISVRITQVGSNSNAKEVWEEETEGTGTFEPKYETVFGSIDVDVVVISDHECLPTECDDVESDIIRAFDWCGNTAVTVGRLTQEQQDCISDFVCGVCDPVQIQVNGTDTETAASGTTYDQEIENSAGAAVGTAANPSVVGDSNVTVNSSAFDSVVAEGAINVPVQYENGTPVGNITSGVVEIPDPVTPPSVEVTVYSDAGFTNPITEANIGQTVYVKAVASDITPTSYRFEFECSDNIPQLLYEGANDNTSWVVSGAQGAGRFFGHVTDDDENWVGEDEDFTIQGDADVDAFLTATGITDATIESALNVLVSSIKSDGTWAKCTAIYPCVGGTSNTHKYNLKDPQDTDGAFRMDFNGGWTHGSNGMLPNGTNSYADTHLTPSSEQSLTSAHFSIYSRTVAASVSSFGGSGIRNSTGTQAINITIRRNTGNLSYATCWDETQASDLANAGASTDGRGFYLMSRTAADNLSYYKNGSLLVQNTTPSTSSVLPSDSYFLSAFNQSGSPLGASYDNKEIAFATIGDGLTSSEQSDLYDAIQVFQTTLGRNV